MPEDPTRQSEAACIPQKRPDFARSRRCSAKPSLYPEYIRRVHPENWLRKTGAGLRNFTGGRKFAWLRLRRGRLVPRGPLTPDGAVPNQANCSRASAVPDHSRMKNMPNPWVSGPNGSGDWHRSRQSVADSVDGDSWTRLWAMGDDIMVDHSCCSGRCARAYSACVWIDCCWFKPRRHGATFCKIVDPHDNPQYPDMGDVDAGVNIHCRGRLRRRRDYSGFTFWPCNLRIARKLACR